ncbi:hypothetical protein ACWEKT_25630 [Nocardia takedensis]
MSELGRFIVAGSPVIIEPLAEALDRDPEATVSDLAPARPAPPQRFVVSLPEQRVLDLHATFGDALTIERDEPLHPLNPTVPQHIRPQP